MPSAVKADRLEAALAAAIRRFDGPSPVTAQVHAHFGAAGEDGPRPRRFHMQLVLEVIAVEGGPLDDGVDVACAVEILYHSTLVHDAVAGGGSPFGLAHGINAGDALCAMAYLQLLEGPVQRSPEETVRMTRALQAANFAHCGGDRAALVAVACELGALVAGASRERAEAYARLGRSYAQALPAEGDALAAGASIDRSGRVRTLLARGLRSAAA